MKNLKTHWPAVFHALALGAVWLSPSVSAYLHGLGGQAGATGIIIWAEVMRWMQSPKGAIQ